MLRTLRAFIPKIFHTPQMFRTPPVVAAVSNTPAMESTVLVASAAVATGEVARGIEGIAQVSARSLSFWQNSVDAAAPAVTEMLEPISDTLYQSLSYYEDALTNLPHAITSTDPMVLAGFASIGLWWIIIRRYEKGQIRSPLINSIFRKIFPGIGPYDR